jgi:peptide-methionine (R)-S-oxide reductase
MTTRRLFLTCGAFGLAAAATLPWRSWSASSAQTFEVNHSEAEWRKLLTPVQYAVLRESATEPPFTSPLLGEHRTGAFVCAGCNLDLFSSTTKFDSGTGWPSFWAPLDGAIRTSSDRTLLEVRTEVHCRRCGGHLGHVFDDGPQPTGQRYCMNGVAMTFEPEGA